MIRMPFFSLLIVALWLALAPQFSVGQLVLALLAGWWVPIATRRFWPNPPRLHRPMTALRLTLRVIVDIVAANVQVAMLILGPQSRLRPTFVEMPLRIDEPFVAAILAGILSLTPGTVVLEYDPDGRRLLIHALNAPNPAQLLTGIRERYEQPLKEIFAC
ncbi:MAG: Na+/H+ antiporter subunit E [Steroidobacteraceae bacterium]|nr:Na+/H+ antiporter subunit E [Steroidobacteraceae bacterium]MDW8259106.1 Na+/H+ antiporter subunit E [Gammaproteobacteria bacterium]